MKVERCETILTEEDYRRKNCIWWMEYLDSFPKLKEKYAREYERLQYDLSKEEYDTIAGILRYEESLLNCLMQQYDDYVKETIENNYATGKVEVLYKGYINSKELMCNYPEETEKLMKYYGPEFDQFYFEKDGSPRFKNVWRLSDIEHDFRFSDISYVREFIERNQVFSQYVITDKEYTVISNKLRDDVARTSVRGTFGKFTSYSITYENFLKAKEHYPEDIAFFASQETEMKDIWFLISKIRPYLTTSEVEYIV